MSRSRAVVASHFLSVAEGYIATAVAERTAMQSLMIEEAKGDADAARREVLKMRDAMRAASEALTAEVADSAKVSAAWAIINKYLRESP